MRVLDDPAGADDHDRPGLRRHRPVLTPGSAGRAHASASARACACASSSAVGASPVTAAVSMSSTMCDIPASFGVSGISRARSEEHTSELQSLMLISYAAFYL